MRRRREPINWRHLAYAALWDIAWLVIVVGLIAAIVGTATAATVLDSSVIVRVQDHDGGTSGGSGTIIDSRGGHSLVLTCGHVFRDAPTSPVQVTLHDGRSVVGKLLRWAESPDLALVSVPVESTAVAPLLDSVSLRMPTVTVGLFSLKRGPIRSVNAYRSDKYAGGENFTVARATAEGDSGGGVFTEQGELVGVHWGGDGSEAFVVAAPVVRRFLETIGIRETGCRWTRDACGNWIKICDEQPPSFVPPSQPQILPPPVAHGPQQPPTVTLPTVQPAENRVAKVESQITTINQQITNLQATVNAAKPCECGQCCDRLREEFNAKIETLSESQLKIIADIKAIHEAKPDTSKYDELAKQLDHDTPIRVYLPDGKLAGESKTNLFRGESIDFTFNPRALLDATSGEK